MFSNYYVISNFKDTMNFSDYIKTIRQNWQRYFTLKQAMMDLDLSKNAALVGIHRLKKHGDLMTPVKGYSSKRRKSFGFSFNSIDIILNF